MPNKKAKNSAAKRINKIDHFLNLIEGMTHKLTDEDTHIIAEYLSRRVAACCEKITRTQSTNIFNIDVTLNPESGKTVVTKTKKNKHDIYCAWCKCWHDKALHKNETTIPKTI